MASSGVALCELEMVPSFSLPASLPLSYLGQKQVRFGKLRETGAGLRLPWKVRTGGGDEVKGRR